MAHLEYEIKITGSGTVKDIQNALLLFANALAEGEDYDGYEGEDATLAVQMKTYEVEVEDWVCTDIDTNQYRRKISDMVWEFKEDRVINPSLGTVGIYYGTVDLKNYSLEEMQEECACFEYSAEKVKKWWTNQENLGLIAECIFELSN